ncbi:MAG: hypothetical protein ACK4PI_05785 [Tepidisphaerales bacterium]
MSTKRVAILFSVLLLVLSGIVFWTVWSGERSPSQGWSQSNHTGGRDDTSKLNADIRERMADGGLRTTSGNIRISPDGRLPNALGPLESQRQALVDAAKAYVDMWSPGKLGSFQLYWESSGRRGEAYWPSDGGNDDADYDRAVELLIELNFEWEKAQAALEKISGSSESTPYLLEGFYLLQWSDRSERSKTADQLRQLGPIRWPVYSSIRFRSIESDVAFVMVPFGSRDPATQPSVRGTLGLKLSRSSETQQRWVVFETYVATDRPAFTRYFMRLPR